MSRRPQNGPSFSKSTYDRKKPLTDRELADVQDHQIRSAGLAQARAVDAQTRIATRKRFKAAVDANNGVIPMRGGDAKAFWDRND